MVVKYVRVAYQQYEDVDEAGKMDEVTCGHGPYEVVRQGLEQIHSTLTLIDSYALKAYAFLTKVIGITTLQQCTNKIYLRFTMRLL